MKADKKFLGPAIFTIIILFGASLHQYFYNQKILKEIEFQKAGDTAYQYLITSKDTSPLPGANFKLPILMYHHVGLLPVKPSALRKDLTVLPADFEEQIKWLADNNYKSISLKNLYEYSLGRFTMPEKPIILTFDDGYQDVFTYAVPILRKYNFIGSFGIITQFPGTENGDNAYASWEEIATAYLAGNEIVSHSQNHFDGANPKFSAEFINSNLCNSKTDIKNHLGYETNVLIYPYGHYTEEYIKEAKKCGFDLGLAVHAGSKINLDNLMEIPRLRIHGNQNFEKFKRLLP